MSHEQAWERMLSVHPEAVAASDSVAAAPSVLGDAANVTQIYVQTAAGNYGHAWILHNPSEHFAILEPIGGCGANRQPVSATARAAGCVVATNAGFFDTSTGECLGTIVADGVIVQNTGYQNANFGLRAATGGGGGAELVAGYLPASNVSEGTFTSLVAGVLWIVRGGEVYVEQSLTVENMTVQETGAEFATLISARTAIGFDALGQVVLLQIEGKSYQRGVNLFEMAKMMIDLGVESAVKPLDPVKLWHTSSPQRFVCHTMFLTPRTSKCPPLVITVRLCCV